MYEHAIIVIRVEYFELLLSKYRSSAFPATPRGARRLHNLEFRSQRTCDYDGLRVSR